MKIAVIGSGISGLGSAWLLDRAHDVVLFEQASRLGGHTHTHTVRQGGRDYAIDSGFIVWNPVNYRLFGRFLEELGVASQPTEMSFSVQNERSGLVYAATDLDTLFHQRRNLVSPTFGRMLVDLGRFYRNAPKLLSMAGPGPTLREFLARGGYSQSFAEDHLVPMASALWSSPSEAILDFPAKYLVRFMDQHRMLQASGRPEWRVVTGGSSRYIDALVARWSVDVRTDAPVERVAREPGGVVVSAAGRDERFDHVVIACHSDQALAMLASPSEAESSVLGAIGYQPNEVVLHTDRRLLPPERRVWSAWNAYVPRAPDAPCTVSYCMNLLQGVDSEEPFVVTLNDASRIDPSKVIARMRYAHPIYTHASIAAQARIDEIDGVDRVSFAGAYWGFGFHEDGLRSAVRVARSLGVRWP